MSMLARFKLTVTAVSHHTVVWHSWLLNPLLLWRKGLLLTGKAWIVGIWRRQVADTRKCLLQTTCCRRSIVFCWCETVIWWFVFVCFFFLLCLESQQTIFAGNPQEMGGWRCLTALWKHVSCVMSALSAGVLIQWVGLQGVWEGRLSEEW